MPPFFKKFGAFIDQLSSRPSVAGLQVSDSMLKAVVAAPDGEHTFSLRLPPDVIREGKILDAKKLGEHLGQLRAMITTAGPKQAVPAVVVLPPDLVYTQSFSIPNLGTKKMEESIKLNLQMLSPLPEAGAYMSSQLIRELPDHYELLGAFADRKIVDTLRDLLDANQFYPIAFEFPSLALTRVVGEGVRSFSKPVLVFEISSEGLTLFIVRGGALQFDYFRSWQSIQGNEREVPRAVFEGVVGQEVQKVLNFIVNKFHEAPEQILLIAPGLENDLQSLLENNFHLPVTVLTLRQWALSSVWYVALGAALRGATDRSRDTAISLAPLSSSDLFFQDQLLGFFSLWRNIVGGVLSLYLLFFIGTAYLVVTQAQNVERQLQIFNDAPQQRALAGMYQTADAFNGTVAAVTAVRGEADQWSVFTGRISALARANRITIEQIDAASLKVPVSVLAQAEDYDTVIKFKQVLDGQQDIAGVDLPLQKITTNGDGTVSFAITFQFKSDAPHT